MGYERHFFLFLFVSFSFWKLFFLEILIDIDIDEIPPSLIRFMHFEKGWKKEKKDWDNFWL